jgi:isopentenyl diphosphate isomerase/L-lactate dehydrogenase-like FMN-dependent dehydrogenase
METVNMASSDQITRAYLDSLLIEPRYIDSVEPSTEYQLFGETFATPIMPAAMGMLKRVREGGAPEFAQAIVAANTVNWAGYIDGSEVEQCVQLGAKVIRIVKPFEDKEKIIEMIKHDEKCGALAIGMDIDHIFNAQGKYFPGGFGQLGRQTMEDIKSYVAASKLPIILKGILSLQDVYKCMEIGVGGIVLSHHKGAFDYAVPPVMVLPEIVKAVNGQFPVIVDCGIATGYDAFKALALGASGVCVGRPLLKIFGENGPDGVKERIEQMTAELVGIMARTGTPDLAHMDPTVIRRRQW